jgi:hypothetical protein
MSNDTNYTMGITNTYLHTYDLRQHQLYCSNHRGHIYNNTSFITIVKGVNSATLAATTYFMLIANVPTGIKT